MIVIVNVSGDNEDERGEGKSETSESNGEDEKSTDGRPEDKDDIDAGKCQFC